MREALPKSGLGDESCFIFQGDEDETFSMRQSPSRFFWLDVLARLRRLPLPTQPPPTEAPMTVPTVPPRHFRAEDTQCAPLHRRRVNEIR